MTTPAPARAAERIAHILERFHETHRRELPEILRLATAIEARGTAPGLAATFEDMAQGLEDHMFKEEMRLFPMMEQGGDPLLPHLVQDMREEHVDHREVMAHVGTRLATVQVTAAGAADLAALRAAVAKLFDDLEQHIAAEDDDLFLLFPGLASPGRAP